MRVLATCVPAPGHVNPLLPLLAALAAQGDDVVVASGADARAAVEAADLRFTECGSGVPQWFGALAARTRGNPGEGLPAERIEAYFVPRLFAEIAADDMIDPLLAIGRDFGPDLVLFETETFAAPLAAAVLDKPAVHLQIVQLPTAETRALVADAATPLWRSFGQELDRDRSLLGELILRTSPDSVQPWPDLPVEAVPLRPTALPTASRIASDRPLVHATLGTMTNQVDHRVYRAIVDALADEPVDVLLALGPDGDPADLGTVPTHVQVERYVSYSDLLPRCSAVITHGGTGTMYAALAHALPQVALPQAADQFTNAAALDRGGLAITLQPDRATPEAIRAAVRTVLDDPSYTHRAAAAAAELAAMPDPGAVARELRARFN